MTKKSHITGAATIVFGGAIGIGIHYNNEENEVGIYFSELKEQLEAGSDIGDRETYDPQVVLVFDNMTSINVVRQAIDLAERTLKDGVIPKKGGEK